MKKIVAIVITLIMLISFAGCKEEPHTHSGRVKAEGTLMVGVTERKPMNYKEDGKWTGFDTEFAKLFAKKELGVDVEFVEIVWSERFKELEEGNVDCVWNGFTRTMYEDNLATFSNGYVKSMQTLVMRANKVDNYTDGFQIKDLQFVVEEGSAGEFYLATRNGYPNIARVKTQVDALNMVSSAAAEATVVDLSLANAVIGKGKQYPELGIGFEFSNESYCVAFQKGSDIAGKLDAFIEDVRDDELKKLADKYDLTLAEGNDK